MFRSADDFSIPALFHETLSGEFKPRIDPKKRRHNLARLALATFVNGEDRSSNTRAYQPSWAEGVTAFAHFRKPFDCKGPAEELYAFALEAEGVATLGLRTARMYTIGFEETLYVGDGTWNWQTEQRYNIAFGTNLEAARDMVTKEAQTFFKAALAARTTA